MIDAPLLPFLLDAVFCHRYTIKTQAPDHRFRNANTCVDGLYAWQALEALHQRQARILPNKVVADNVGALGLLLLVGLGKVVFNQNLLQLERGCLQNNVQLLVLLQPDI